MTEEVVSTPPKKTRIIKLLDESGSMFGTADDVRGGFNTYIETLKTDGNEYTVTAIKFGTTVRPLFTNLPLNEVPLLTKKNYAPSGSTALYDAIGYTLDEEKKQSATGEKPYGEDSVIFIIMTDGFENASKKFSKETIVARMKRREAAGNWSFIYLGADQDAWSIAQGLGMAQGNVMSYASADTPQVFNQLASSTSTSATSTAPSTRSFFSE